MQKEIRCRERECASMEKNSMSESLLSDFEILGSSDRGGDDYEEIEKIRLTEKKEDSCKIRERIRKLYKRIFIRRYWACK